MKKKNQGDVVTYAEILEQDYNVMCIKIENIPPKTEIEIQFSFLERVDISLNKFWRFTLPSCILSQNHNLVPRNPEKNIKVIASYPTTKMNFFEENGQSQDRLKWEINVIINANSAISYLKCQSHDIKTDFSQHENSFSVKVSLDPEKNYIFTKDFILLYAIENIIFPHYFLSPYEGGFCTLLSFFPTTNYLTFDDAPYKEKILWKILLARQKENIFLYLIKVIP